MLGIDKLVNFIKKKRYLRRQGQEFRSYLQGYEHGAGCVLRAGEMEEFLLEQECRSDRYFRMGMREAVRDYRRLKIELWKGARGC